MWIDSSSTFHSYGIWLVKGPIRWHFHLWFPSSLWGCFRIKKPHWANGGRSWHTLSGKFLAMLWEIESIWGSSLDQGIPKHSQSLDQYKNRALPVSCCWFTHSKILHYEVGFTPDFEDVARKHASRPSSRVDEVLVYRISTIQRQNVVWLTLTRANKRLGPLESLSGYPLGVMMTGNSKL